jgi:hypothetical protein
MIRSVRNAAARTHLCQDVVAMILDRLKGMAMAIRRKLPTRARNADAAGLAQR